MARQPAGSRELRSAEQAQQAVQSILDGRARDGGVSCGAGTATDGGDHWVVGLQSRRYQRGEVSAALTGNEPFAVPKDGSAPYRLPLR